ncbi:MAG: UbiA family prenyltransferase, partial [Actinomycetota bacterium]
MPDVSLRSLARRMPSLTRAADWWSHKVPIVLAVAFLVLLGSGPAPEIGVGQASWSVLAFLVAVIGVAGLGHVINDLFDAEQDRAAGRARAAAEAGPRTRLALFAGLTAAALVPWTYLPADALVWGLLGLELALLVGYSTPPVRAKERGGLALLFDASYAYVVPLALAVATFSNLPVGPSDDLGAITAAVLVWSLAVGLRSIVFHQIDDLEDDRAAGVNTWVVRVGRPTARKVLGPLLVLEGAGLAAVVVTATARLPLLGPLLALGVAYRWFQLRVLAGLDAAVEEVVDPERRLRRIA